MAQDKLVGALDDPGLLKEVTGHRSDHPGLFEEWRVMHRRDGKLVVSATDLVGFLECGH